MTTRPKPLPLRLNTAILAPFFQPGDAAVIVKMVGVGSTAPFELRAGGSAGRSFILEWNSRLDGHVVRIPLSLWMASNAQLAHELMDHRRMSHALVVTFEMPAPAPDTTAQTATAERSASTSTSGGYPALAASASPSPTLSPPAAPLAQTGAAENDETASIVVGRGPGPRSAAPTPPPNTPTSPRRSRPKTTKGAAGGGGR